jgi:hypothetical protein
MPSYTATLDVNRGPHQGRYEKIFGGPVKARDWIRNKADNWNLRKSDYNFKVVPNIQPVQPRPPPIAPLPDISEAFPGHEHQLNPYATPYHAFSAPRER